MTPRPGWFAHPVLSVLIGATWLLLQRSLEPLALLGALLLGLLLPRLLHGLLTRGTRLHRPAAVLRFAGLVLWDIVVANLTVARLVLDPRARPQPAWVSVPLALHDPVAISLLATVITMTPGTVSCVVEEGGHGILVHALDCPDAAALAAQIKQRYELPLLEIFG
ncbi:MAG: Na+/H+ antiporter subunit E [Piscinibacter sp.]|nr:Na+/H+ antiporter subunit E [Piscinibacter sp.]